MSLGSDRNGLHIGSSGVHGKCRACGSNNSCSRMWCNVAEVGCTEFGALSIQVSDVGRANRVTWRGEVVRRVRSENSVLIIATPLTYLEYVRFCLRWNGGRNNPQNASPAKVERRVFQDRS